MKLSKNKLLSNAPSDRVFWICDGRIIKNVFELLNALATMRDETYEYHIKRGGNDFARWIYDVFGAKKLASRLQNVKQRERAIKIIKKAVEEAKEKKVLDKTRRLKEKDRRDKRIAAEIASGYTIKPWKKKKKKSKKIKTKKARMKKAKSRRAKGKTRGLKSHNKTKKSKGRAKKKSKTFKQKKKSRR